MKKYKNYEYHFLHTNADINGRDLAVMPEKNFAIYMEQLKMEKENKKYQISPNFILREIAGEYVIVPVGEDNIFSNTMMAPNDTAAFLWKAFEQPSTVEDVVIKSLQEYDAAEDVIRESIQKFIKECLESKILLEVE